MKLVRAEVDEDDNDEGRECMAMLVQACESAPLDAKDEERLGRSIIFGKEHHYPFTNAIVDITTTIAASRSLSIQRIWHSAARKSPPMLAEQ